MPTTVDIIFDDGPPSTENWVFIHDKEPPSTPYYAPDFSTFSIGFVGYENKKFVASGLTAALWGQAYRARIPVPQGVNIISATLFLTTTNFGGSNISLSYPPVLKLNAHKHINSPGPSNLSDCLSQSTTGATTAYNLFQVANTVMQGTTYQLTGIEGIIQELVDDASWAQNNFATFYLKCETPATAAEAVGKDALSGYSVFNPYVWQQPPINSNPSKYQYLPKLRIVYEPVISPGGEDFEVVHDLEIDHFMDWDMLKRTVEHELLIEQDIDYERVHNRTVYSDDLIISLQQDIHIVGNQSRSVESQLFVFDVISVTKVLHRTVESVLEITQTIERTTNLDQNVISTLDIEQDISYTKDYGRSVTHDLELTQDIHSNIQCYTLYDAIDIQQDIDLEATLQNPEQIVSELEITQDISFSINQNKSVEHVLAIQQHILGYLIRSDCNITLTYSPQGDEVINSPALGVLSTQPMTLEYPPGSSSLTVTIPAPLFGNREELNVTRIQRETRGGDLKTFTDSDWPVVRTFRYTFEKITEAVKADLLSFFEDTLGLQVRLTDYEGRVWDGFVINPNGEFSDLDDTACDNTFEFDFTGESVP